MMRPALACLLVLFLPACESISPVVTETADPAVIRERHARLVESLSSWTLEGRISVRYEEEAWHAGLFWHQVNDIYQIRIIAPFGQGGAQLDGSAHGVVLNNGEGEFRARSAEQLLAERFGWHIPVEGLRFWATGRPAPGQAPRADYDINGRITSDPFRAKLATVIDAFTKRRTNGAIFVVSTVEDSQMGGEPGLKFAQAVLPIARAFLDNI